jgi:GT2 family glycosyltransferase
VLVVDGHSSDETVKNATKFPVKLVYENYGTRGGACQVGIENAKGEYVAFTDADCIPHRTWLENLIKEFDGDIVGVGGGIKNLGKGIWEKSINIVMGTFLGNANSVQGKFFQHKKYVKSISGSNSMYRRKDLLKVGGFDPYLPTAEDAAINRRLLKIGKLLYIPQAIVFHNHKRGLREFAKRMYHYGYGRGKSRLWDLVIIPPLLLPFLLILSLFAPLVLLSVIIVYIVMLVVMGAKFAIQERSFKYFISVPIVYTIEHGLYIIGFWRGYSDRR